jgi:predicted RNase H-like nuclease
MILVAGIDGTKGGWVVVLLEDGAFAGDLIVHPIESSFDALRELQVIAIDVPIGFGPRQADAAARAFLSGAASTVFTTARREVLEMPFGPGLGVSAQSHALGPRIIHVTDLAQTDPRVFEVHPEVSFRAMNDRRPLLHRKKSAGGALERVELLRAHGIDLSRIGETSRAPLDDVLDAGAAAWSAHRIGIGLGVCLPDPPERVGGRDVAIWY